MEQKIRTLEEEKEEDRMVMEKVEKKTQKEVDVLRSNYLKIESEKTLKEKEITEIRDEIATIRNQIAQVGAFLLRIYFYNRNIFDF